MKHGSLFSGIGGAELAASWLGWENVFHCEIKEYNLKLLKQHFPESISYEDIKTTEFIQHRGRIDVLTGGFPCQSFSTAGKRKGTADDRYLWPEMLRAIREIQPRWIVGENVRGLTNWNGGMVFDQVQADMEAEGYEIIPFLFPACAVNAPHRRDRIWFIALAINRRSQIRRAESGRCISKKPCGQNQGTNKLSAASQSSENVAITNIGRSQRRKSEHRICNKGDEV